MLAILLLIEFAGWSATISIIAWLRHASGENLGPYHLGARYFLPFGAALFFGIALLLAIQWAMTGSQPGPIAPASWVLVGGIIVAALVVLLVVEARRYRARPRGGHPVNRARSRLQ